MDFKKEYFQSKLYSELSDTRKIVLHSLVKKAVENECIPTVDFLKSDTSLSLATIGRSIKELNKKGIVDVFVKKTYVEGTMRNKYILNLKVFELKTLIKEPISRDQSKDRVFKLTI
jgi:DNA-binding transcriptional regulator YhcF (GntR family)